MLTFAALAAISMGVHAPLPKVVPQRLEAGAAVRISTQRVIDRRLSVLRQMTKLQVETQESRLEESKKFLDATPSPTSKTVETVVMRLTDPKSVPCADLPVQVTIISTKARTVRTVNASSGPDGTISVEVDAFPALVSLALATNDWVVARPGQASVLSLTGTEGETVAMLAPTMVAALNSFQIAIPPKRRPSVPVVKKPVIRTNSPRRPVGKSGRNTAAKLPTPTKNKPIKTPTPTASEKGATPPTKTGRSSVGKPKEPVRRANSNPAPVKRPNPAPAVTAGVIRRRYEWTQPLVVVPASTLYTIHTLPGAQVEVGNQKATADSRGDAQIRLPQIASDQTPLEGFVTVDTPAAKRAGRVILPATELPEIRVNASNVSVIAPKDLVLTKMRSEALSLWADDFRPVYGRPEADDYELFGVKDGSQWWRWDKEGIWLKVRPIYVENGREQNAVERVRLVKSSAGSLAGLSVGATRTEVIFRLGSGEVADDPRPAGKLAYADSGVIFGFDSKDRVEWIEVRRATDLLAKGISQVLPTSSFRLFIPPVRGAWSQRPEVAKELREHLASIPGVEYVNDRETADFALDLEVSNLEEARGMPMGSYFFDYLCSASLRGQLAPVMMPGIPVAITASGSQKANFGQDVKKGPIGLNALSLILGNTVPDEDERRAAKSLTAEVGQADIAKLPDLMTRATIRAQSALIRDLAQQTMATIQSVNPFEIAVLSINRQKGTLDLNAGTRHGLQEGTEFEIRNGAYPVRPSVVGGLFQDYLVARVTSVQVDRATCTLFRVERRISMKMREYFEERPDPSVTLGILDPATDLPVAIPLVRMRDLSPTN